MAHTLEGHSNARVGSVARGSGLRLTRRGRLVIGVVSLAFFLVVLALGWAGATAWAGSLPTDRAAAVTVVQPGESLWSVAQRTFPDQDPRVVSAQIAELNGVTARTLQAGQELQLPTD